MNDILVFVRTTHTYKTEGIILGRKNFGEADRLLTILTPRYGKVCVIAKGIRRPMSRKRSQLELFNEVTLFLAKGRNLDIITEAEVKNDFKAWRKDLLKVGVAYHLSEVVEKLTREGEELPRVYSLLLNAFTYLDSVGYWQLHEWITYFKEELLSDLGFLSGKKDVGDLDMYIEQLTQSKLKTKRFLKTLE